MLSVSKFNADFEQPRADDLEELFYRFLTVMELKEPEDLAIARSVLHMDARKHFNDNQQYYRQRFDQIRRG